MYLMTTRSRDARGRRRRRPCARRAWLRAREPLPDGREGREPAPTRWGRYPRPGTASSDSGPRGASRNATERRVRRGGRREGASPSLSMYLNRAAARTPRSAALVRLWQSGSRAFAAPCHATGHSDADNTAVVRRAARFAGLRASPWPSARRSLRTRSRRPAARDRRPRRSRIREKQQRRADCSYPCKAVLPDESEQRPTRSAGTCRLLFHGSGRLCPYAAHARSGQPATARRTGGETPDYVRGMRASEAGGAGRAGLV